MVHDGIRKFWYQLSIKNKQLLFFVVIITLVGVLNIYTQYSASTYMHTFRSSITSYYSIDELRVELTRAQRASDAYLRTLDQDSRARYFQHNRQTLSAFLHVRPESETSLDAFFQVNAIHYGLIAYFDAVADAFNARESGDELYYVDYHRSQRIYGYIINYIEELLRIRLQEGSVAYSELLEEARRMRMISLGTIIFIAALFIAFAYLFSHSITGPVRDLANASKKMASGELDVNEISVSSEDEVGILADSFNVMSRSIRVMVDDIKQKAVLEKRLHDEEMANISMAKSLREAQFLSLQTQINPHFLFNTLNTIARVSMFEQAEQTTKLIESLSSLFRYNLKDGAKHCTLQEELEILKEYLHIQQVRFRERLLFTLDCTVSPETIQLPSFTIQPLVENAVRHGIEPKESGGMVRIRIRKKESMVEVKVHDSGIGIVPERLEIIRCASQADFMHIAQSDEAHGGIGIANVAQRLSLFYNGMSSLTLHSKPNFGTLVTIRFPAELGGTP